MKTVRVRRRYLWLFASVLALLLFLRITHDLQEQVLDCADDLLRGSFAGIRTPWLTFVVAKLTVLGSFAAATIVSLFAILVLCFKRNWMAVLQILLCLIGTAIWTPWLKNEFQRARPNDIPALVHASGYAYPSGHSLTAAAIYLTLAIVGAASIKHKKARIAITAAACVLVLLVGLSRIYLGAHYPSDVAAGVLLGAAWAFLLAALFARESIS